MRVTLIAALAKGRVLGRDGEIPWRLPADLRRFQQRTMGHHLVVGRRTWESIGRPLPGRRMVVVTRQTGYRAPGARVVGSLDEALRVAEAAGESEVFVAGGGEIYRQALPRADRLDLTEVEWEVEAGDTFFPEIDQAAWREVSREAHPADERNPHPYTFVVYQRRRRKA